MRVRTFIPIIFLLAALLVIGTGERAAAAQVILKNATSLYTKYLGVDPISAAKKIVIGAGFPIKEEMNIAAFRFESFIHYNPKDKTAADSIRSLLGVGTTVEDTTLDPGLVKVILGADAIGVLFPGRVSTPGVIILDATGRGGNGASVAHSIESSDRVLSVFSVNKGMMEKTTILYPKAEAREAEGIRALLGRGLKKEIAGLPNLFVVVAPDYIGETFKNIPDWAPTPGQKYDVVVYKTRAILELVDASGKTVVSYPVSIGANPDLADKKASGDRRTPEGNYFISGISESSGWKFEGEFAYGPWFFALNTPPWTGYAIHGTNEPYLIGAPASHGCIRLNVENLRVLKKAVGVGTWVKIVH